MKRMILFVLPIMIIVTTLAMWWLNKHYSDIDQQTRLIIAIGGAVFSGVISYFMFGSDTEKFDSRKDRRQ